MALSNASSWICLNSDIIKSTAFAFAMAVTKLNLLSYEAGWNGRHNMRAKTASDNLYYNIEAEIEDYHDETYVYLN